MSNALKFTPENGNINVELCLLEAQVVTGERIPHKLSKSEEIKSEARRVSVVDETKFNQREYNSGFLKFILKIKDTGVGINPENISNLFVDFGKLDEHEKINTQGTGLGLSICKQLVEQMGGSVSVQSELGEGTCFNIHLNAQFKMKVESDFLRIKTFNFDN